MTFLRVVSLLALISVALPAADRAPNIVLILADDVGYECFGLYGSKQYSTPALNRLADSGVKFNHCYSKPLCSPSRVAIMTGKDNVRNYLDFGVIDKQDYTFADFFRKAGYKTAIAGKWQLQGSENAKGTLPSEARFDTYCLWNTPMTARPRYWTPSIEQNGKLLTLDKDAYGPDVFANFLIEFMEENKDRPFFAYYPMALVHDPFLPTPDSADRSSEDQQKNFEDMVAYMDKLVGRIAGALERLDLTRNTVLIFTSDNGTHSQITSRLNGRTIPGEKGRPNDGGTHVPMVIHAPGIAPGGRVIDDLIDFTDVLPTLADIAGLTLPAEVQVDGRSFWPQVEGKKGEPRDWSFTYYFPRPFAEKFDHEYRHPEVRFVRDTRYKLYGDGRFFDLHNDVNEKRPIGPGDGPAEAKAARQKLAAALASMPEHGAQTPRR